MIPVYSTSQSRNFICSALALTRFSSVFGHCYLQDQSSPTLAILPQQLFVYHQGRYLNFQRLSDFTYKKIEEKLTVEEVYTRLIKAFPHQQPATATIAQDVSFNGGVLGFISYDFAASLNIDLKQMHPQPSLVLGMYDHYLKQENEGWYLYSPIETEKQCLDYLTDYLNPAQSSLTATTFSKMQPRWSYQDYAEAFHKVQDYIVAGDCYQINLTQEFKAQLDGNLFDASEKFWHATNAPLSGYLRFDDFELLSCSPELFIEFQPQHKMITRPIKGTMPRYSDPIEDARSKQQLAESAKDQAENVMIVDLLRNDLSLYAETGTVKTTQLFEIESFQQVHHMVSEIEAKLKPDIHPLKMLLDAMPGGSITGAPKIRAMQIIDELEQAPRGAYCGSMGYFNFDGTGRWNILIRSIQKYQSDVSLWAGGGVTIASTCEAEYQECFDKVSAMMNLFNDFYQPITK